MKVLHDDKRHKTKHPEGADNKVQTASTSSAAHRSPILIRTHGSDSIPSADESMSAPRFAESPSQSEHLASVSSGTGAISKLVTDADGSGADAADAGSGEFMYRARHVFLDAVVTEELDNESTLATVALELARWPSPQGTVPYCP